MKPYIFNTSFSQLLQKNNKKENKKTIMTGDFNLNLLNYTKNIGTYEPMNLFFQTTLLLKLTYQ